MCIVLIAINHIYVYTYLYLKILSRFVILGIEPVTLSETEPKMQASNSIRVYICAECEYAAKTASQLQRHKESKHRGIRFPCDQCEFKAVTKGQLKVHNENKHLGKTSMIKILCLNLKWETGGLKKVRFHSP